MHFTRANKIKMLVNTSLDNCSLDISLRCSLSVMFLFVFDLAKTVDLSEMVFLIRMLYKDCY